MFQILFVWYLFFCFIIESERPHENLSTVANLSISLFHHLFIYLFISHLIKWPLSWYVVQVQTCNGGRVQSLDKTVWKERIEYFVAPTHQGFLCFLHDVKNEMGGVRLHCFLECNPPSLTDNPPHLPSYLCGLQSCLFLGDLRLFQSIQPWISPTRLTWAAQVRGAAARGNRWLYFPSSCTHTHTYKPINKKHAWNWKYSSHNTHLSCQ